MRPKSVPPRSPAMPRSWAARPRKDGRSSAGSSRGMRARIPWRAMPDPWVRDGAERIARHAERELEALVAVSSPSGDVRGAEEAVAIAAALLPAEAEIERLPCSTRGSADDLLGRVTGTGEGRLLLLGHVDTVIAHGEHQPLLREDGRLVGSGTSDMKGGVVLSLGVLRELAARPDAYAEVALLLVVDEEWRTTALQHAGRFEGWDACLCFEAGERTRGGEGGVVVGRQAGGGGGGARGGGGGGGRGGRRPRPAPRTRARRPTVARMRCSASPPPRRPW